MFRAPLPSRTDGKPVERAAMENSGLSDVPVGVEDTIRALCAAGHFGHAATALLRAYGPSILSFLASRTAGRETAPEVFANFSAAMWKALPRVRWRTSIRSWAFAVARNELRAFMRIQNSWQQRHASLTDLDEHLLAVGEEATAHHEQARQRKLDAIHRVLAPADRSLLLLRLQGWTWAEIATHTLGARGGESRDAMRREAARLRKRYQLLTGRLRALERGALEPH